ncbi:hypothetical protein yaldo0001_6420 [Yersinia aldovae ATCC 35236]|nr:hypothetical protein yaldo0001_6420 [Yersinia aldovae ATCC 35236]
MSAIGINFTFGLFLLLCLPLPSVAATPLLPPASRVSDTLINTVPYTLASGETVFTLAKKYHLTLDQLKKIKTNSDHFQNRSLNWALGMKLIFLGLNHYF